MPGRTRQQAVTAPLVGEDVAARAPVLCGREGAEAVEVKPQLPSPLGGEAESDRPAEGGEAGGEGDGERGQPGTHSSLVLLGSSTRSCFYPVWGRPPVPDLVHVEVAHIPAHRVPLAVFRRGSRG